MELKHKGNLLELVFGEDTVTYHGRSWPSGAIAGMVMNITNEANKEKILAELNDYLTENRDRQLFDLPNIEEN